MHNLTQTHLVFCEAKDLADGILKTLDLGFIDTHAHTDVGLLDSSFACPVPMNRRHRP
jgi:hypothetical protein